MSKTMKMLDEIKKRLPRRGPAPLVQRLPPDVYAEMLEVRTAWRAGKLDKPGEVPSTKTALSRLISEGLNERGFSIGQDALVRWLIAKD